MIKSIGRVLLVIGKSLLASFILILMPYYLVKLADLHGSHNEAWLLHDSDHGFFSVLYGFANLVVLPFLQGAIIGREMQKIKSSSLAAFFLQLLILIIDLCLAAIVIREGIICMIMAAPLLIGVMSFGIVTARKTKKIKDGALRLTVAPLIVVFVLYDATRVPESIQNHVEDSMVVNAPPAIVWKYLVTAPEDKSSAKYWLWKAGLPMPNQLFLSKPEIGGVLEFRLSGGIKFDAKISSLVPEKELSFIVTEQAKHPEVYGHIRFDKGRFWLQDNGNGTTTLSAIGWYSLLIQPADYFDLWMKDIVHHVHARVFNNIKQHAEIEWQNQKQNDGKSF